MSNNVDIDKTDHEPSYQDLRCLQKPIIIALTARELRRCTLKNITKTRLFKYIENFTTKNTESLPIKILIFFIFLLKT